MPQLWNNQLLRLLIVSASVATIPIADVLASEGEETKATYAMMQEKGYRCLECHDVEIKVVGPAWKEVSARRKNDKWATAMITYKLSEEGASEYGNREVSVGQYGEAVMPHHDISDEDAQRIARWIMGLDESELRLAIEKECDSQTEDLRRDC